MENRLTMRLPILLQFETALRTALYVALQTSMQWQHKDLA